MIPIYFSNTSLTPSAQHISQQTQKNPQLGNHLISCLTSFSKPNDDNENIISPSHIPTTNTKEIEVQSISSFTDFISNTWPIAQIQDWSGGTKSHAGDMWITWPTSPHNITFMIEMKNWSRTIPSSEIQKFWRDWDIHHESLHGALFISWLDVKITSHKPLDLIYWGPHKKPILFISNASQHITLLEQCINFMISISQQSQQSHHTSSHHTIHPFLQSLSSHLHQQISTLSSEITYHRQAATQKSKVLNKCHQSLSVLQSYISSPSSYDDIHIHTNSKDKDTNIIEIV